MSAAYSEHWVFTINNPAEDASPVVGWPQVVYGVWQLERGENGTPHFQGYVIFATRKRLTWIKEHCDATAHWEPRKGTHQQAKAYCMKDESRVDGPWEHGDEPHKAQGKRNDLLALKRKLDEGVGEAAIAADSEMFAVWAKYWKVIGRYRMLKSMNERRWHTFCQVYWGPPGVGKSSRALEEAGPGAYWLPRPSGVGQTIWWDGYEGQEVVVIDEFYGWIMRDMMQRLCDRYPLLVQTKGGTTPFLAKKIIITSNEHPIAWWPKVGLGAMMRRLEGECGKITQMQDPNVPPAPAFPRPIQRDLYASDVLSPPGSPAWAILGEACADGYVPAEHYYSRHAPGPGGYVSVQPQRSGSSVISSALAPIYE